MAKLICVFVFAYAKRWFSYDAAHLFSGKGLIILFENYALNTSFT